MSSLPSDRVTVSRPFCYCGVNYAGPVILWEGKRCSARNHKAYIAFFMCFATKAIHIELVSKLISDTFLAAFRRFISQKGKPVCMYSDNGTSFVGANKQLKKLNDFVKANRRKQTSGHFSVIREPRGHLYRQMRRTLGVCKRRQWNLPSIICPASLAELIWPLKW